MSASQRPTAFAVPAISRPPLPGAKEREATAHEKRMSRRSTGSLIGHTGLVPTRRESPQAVIARKRSVPPPRLGKSGKAESPLLPSKIASVQQMRDFYEKYNGPQKTHMLQAAKYVIEEKENVPPAVSKTTDSWTHFERLLASGPKLDAPQESPKVDESPADSKRTGRRSSLIPLKVTKLAEQEPVPRTPDAVSKSISQSPMDSKVSRSGRRSSLIPLKVTQLSDQETTGKDSGEVSDTLAKSFSQSPMDSKGSGRRSSLVPLKTAEQEPVDRDGSGKTFPVPVPETTASPEPLRPKISAFPCVLTESQVKQIICLSLETAEERAAHLKECYEKNKALLTEAGVFLPSGSPSNIPGRPKTSLIPVPTAPRRRSSGAGAELLAAKSIEEPVAPSNTGTLSEIHSSAFSPEVLTMISTILGKFDAKSQQNATSASESIGSVRSDSKPAMSELKTISPPKLEVDSEENENRRPAAVSPLAHAIKSLNNLARLTGGIEIVDGVVVSTAKPN